ncbi:hypothetical protein E6C67_02835 (plasmid) [Azospirillum sp. TSA2s]|uniref:hypothetical protein n=1 Tax=Azospirillum sp. TSA2s TaxID=709810 RepID=UPI0010A9B586|nr:hypothetical protein [Azospirillum sp. TSA2s]QCG92905.1 hypothetical protein E6C67_02835 [Azospirillum sp. TSA2s]
MSDNPLISFLRSYGPSAASDALCDEHVQVAVKAHGVHPIEIPAPRLEEIRDALLSNSPTNVILTGTAGDGKTYHIRKFFLDILGEAPETWPGDDGILEATLPGGQRLRILRDLSEVTDALKSQEIAHVTRCLIGEDRSTIYLVAANDGQLLKFWRDAMEAEPSGDIADKFRQVHSILADMLRHDLTSPRDGALSLKLLNLSRSTTMATFETVVNAVLSHEAWSLCAGCSAADVGVARCPILLNRDLLLEAPDGQFTGNLRPRLRDAIRIAAANDQHVPIRQLLTLTVNIILGDKAPGNGQPLLTCTKARSRARDGDYRLTNPYQNAFGHNLRPSYRERYAVFSILDAFGIGHETNNAIDALLIDSKPEHARNKLSARDKEYGETLFSRSRDAYLKGNSTLDPAEFAEMISTQRRRLFFTLPDTASTEPLSPWRLTVFHHGGRYLKFCDALSQGRPDDDNALRQLVKGLNRTLTGMMAEDTEQLWLARAIGRSDGGAGRLTTVPPVQRKGMGNFRISVKLGAHTQRPVLRIEQAFGNAKDGPALDLTPLLFEYLMRVAEGSLPSSFSRQCHQEIRHFAMNAADYVVRAYGESAVAQVGILSVGADGRINSRQIEV